MCGDEIHFQLYCNKFGGVVSKVGTGYVDFSIKGVATINQMMEVETNTSEIKGGCSQ